MSSRKYKRYLEPDSTENIPRQTLYDRRKREKISPNRKEINHYPSTMNASEPQKLTISNNFEENVLFGEMRIDADINNADFLFEDYANDMGQCEQNLHSSSEQHYDNEPIDDMDLFNHETLFKKNPISEEDGNDEEMLDNEYDRFLNETLCPYSVTTKRETLMMTILIGQKHCMIWVAILDIINMINKLCSNDVLPTSKYSLFKHFPLAKDTIKFHLFCPSCHRYLGERQKLRLGNTVVCHICEKNINDVAISSFFVTLNLTYQLQILLNNPNISKLLDHRFSRRKENSNALEDIYDGNIYKKYSTPGNVLHSKWNLSYTFNTDRCQAAKSSKTSIWSIYAMLHELPPEIRSKHMFLIGLWVHNKEPNMNTFLRPFIDEANSLARNGVQWTLKNEIITSKVYPLYCCVDSVARPCILNMIHFNDFYGYNFCEHPTEGVDGYCRYTMSIHVPPNRTDTSIRCRMQNAFNDEIHPLMNMGIKGSSVLMNLEEFDLVDGMVPDYMHSVLLGVTRQYTEIILTSRGEEYYVDSPNQLAIINQRLTSIRPPTCITRSPRTIEEWKCWKVSEWRFWLLWYMLICLRGLLPTEYLRHVALLITSIHILL